MIAQESIERVKADSNIVDVVSETVKLRRAGMYYSGLCPFHSERSPSFFVRDSSNSYICYGCGASGNVISFVMANSAMTFPDAVEYLAGRFGIELKYDNAKTAAPAVDREKLYSVCSAAHLFFRRSLMQVKGGVGEFAQVGTYLKKRGLTADAINAFGIGYGPNQRSLLVQALKQAGFDEETLLLSGLVRRSASGDLYELFRGRLIFPIFVDAKRIAGFGGRVIPGVMEPAYEQQSPKYLNSPETPTYQKSRTIYGLPQAVGAIRELGEVYVVEGYMDVIGLAMKGVHNVVACCGTAMTEQHLKRFSGLCSRVYLLFDGDSAGRAAAAKSFLSAKNADVDVAACFLPDEVDPDDFATQHGEGVAAALKALPKAELIDAYIDGLLTRAGCSITEKPGQNLMGKLSEEVAKALSGVEREVARASLITRAARRLGIETTQLERLVSRGTESATTVKSPERARITEPQSVSQSASLSAVAAGPVVLRGPAELPRIDLDMLRAVMVLKGEVLQELLKNPEACEMLQPETIRFVMDLSAALAPHPDDEERQRSAVKELLQALGADWTRLWKEAYKMVKAEVSMRDLYRESLWAIRREKLRGLLEECKQELLSEQNDPHRQLEISERMRALKTQIDGNVRGVDLQSPNS